MSQLVITQSVVHLHPPSAARQPRDALSWPGFVDVAPTISTKLVASNLYGPQIGVKATQSFDPVPKTYLGYFV